MFLSFLPDCPGRNHQRGNDGHPVFFNLLSLSVMLWVLTDNLYQVEEILFWDGQRRTSFILLVWSISLILLVQDNWIKFSIFAIKYVFESST